MNRELNFCYKHMNKNFIFAKLFAFKRHTRIVKIIILIKKYRNSI